jgi:hypothetical protein
MNSLVTPSMVQKKRSTPEPPASKTVTLSANARALSCVVVKSSVMTDSAANPSGATA